MRKKWDSFDKWRDFDFSVRVSARFNVTEWLIAQIAEWYRSTRQANCALHDGGLIPALSNYCIVSNAYFESDVTVMFVTDVCENPRGKSFKLFSARIILNKILHKNNCQSRKITQNKNVNRKTVRHNFVRASNYNLLLSTCVMAQF